MWLNFKQTWWDCPKIVSRAWERLKTIFGILFWNNTNLGIIFYVEVLTHERTYSLSSTYFLQILINQIHVPQLIGRPEDLWSCKHSPDTWSWYILWCFYGLYMYIAPGQGQTTPWGQNLDVNRNSLTLCPFVASLINLFEIWFFSVF